MHDVSVGNYTTVAPNAVLLGYVTVGEHCYIGASSTILSNRKTGNAVTVGAGAIVTKDFGDKLTVIGNPARIYQPE